MMSYLDVDKYVVKEGRVEPQEDGTTHFIGWQFEMPADMNTSKDMCAAALIWLGNRVNLKLVNMENDE
jgi:hypothetical protein